MTNSINLLKNFLISLEQGEEIFKGRLTVEEYINLKLAITEAIKALERKEAARIKLDKIEKIAREAFSNPETQDINLYRAQALARIFQIFEYDL